MARIILLALLLFSTQAMAQSSIYRTTDENGNVVFTDAPPAGTVNSERIENSHINSMPPPPTVPTAGNGGSNDDEADEGYSVTITSPEDETTFPHGPGNFSVSARVDPMIEGDYKLQLFLDGEAKGSPQSGSSWSLTNVARGEHQLTVDVVDGAGESHATSDPITVFVFRPTAPPPRPRPAPAN